MNSMQKSGDFQAFDLNPFPAADEDRVALWEMLVKRDIDSFIESDWSAVASDFIEEGFYGIDGQKQGNPDVWKLTFPDLTAYKNEWLKQSAESLAAADKSVLREAVFRASRLSSIEIRGDHAVVHKEIKGSVPQLDGTVEELDWQTLYICRKTSEGWRISSFVGYLPYDMGKGAESKPVIQVPEATQHKTAGPYSPVLSIKADEIVVISGQAPLNLDGEVVGDTIEEQTRVTLENCAAQLKNAGCTLADVFKVNVYLTDLDNWRRFNTVYREIMPQPFPARTAVQTPLLLEFQVEIEMWAAKS